MSEFNKSGSKYLREIKCAVNGKVDVYSIIETFQVKCPARQHAIKKILCSGIRGKGDELQDLKEARDAIDRAIQMHESLNPPPVQTYAPAPAPIFAVNRSSLECRIVPNQNVPTGFYDPTGPILENNHNSLRAFEDRKEWEEKVKS